MPNDSQNKEPKYLVQDLHLEARDLADAVQVILRYGVGPLVAAAELKPTGASIFGEFSDILIESDAYIVARRRNKQLVRVSSERVPASVVESFANILANVTDVYLEIERNVIKNGRAELDGATLRIKGEGVHPGENYRVRYNICQIVQPFTNEVEAESKPLSITLRRYPNVILPLPALGLPTKATRVIERVLKNNTSGIIAISGATSQGKTLTSTSMLGEIGRNRAVKMILLEQPPEIPSASISTSEAGNPIKATVIHRAIGEPGGPSTFLAALEAAKRQNPDVIFIGEARDKETKTVAVNTATSGMLVILTTHASTPIESIRELCEASSNGAVARNLRLIIHQALIPGSNLFDAETNSLGYSVSYLVADVFEIDKDASAFIAEGKFQELDEYFYKKLAAKNEAYPMNEQIKSLMDGQLVDVTSAKRASSRPQDM